jgi:energy-coupling factor transport system permease protein
MNATKTRLKLIGLLAASSSIVMVRDIRVIGVLFAATLVLFIICSQAVNLTKRLMPLLTISLFVLCFQVIFNQAIPLTMRIGVGLTTGIKIMTLSLAVFLFSLTTSPSNLLWAFSFLPYTFRLTLTISLSLLPILLKEIGEVKRAQQARGFRTSLRKPFSSLIPIIVPLLHRTLSRAEHIAMVLETRGYDE